MEKKSHPQTGDCRYYKKKRTQSILEFLVFCIFFFFLYEYAIRLEMKDALVGGHEFYRFPLPPLCSTSPPYFRTRVRGFRDFWGLKKKKKKKKVCGRISQRAFQYGWMDAINKQQTTNKQRRGGISFFLGSCVVSSHQCTVLWLRQRKR